jgi:acetolactate synthase-1/2/3 large subunit
VSAKPEKLVAFADVLAHELTAKTPLMILAGYGVLRSNAEEVILELAHRYQVPFATTMDAKGLLPEDHPLSLGVFGTAGDPGANRCFQEARLVVALGNSFAHNATFRFQKDLFAAKRLMHMNIDNRNEINKVYEAD